MENKVTNYDHLPNGLGKAIAVRKAKAMDRFMKNRKDCLQCGIPIPRNPAIRADMNAKRTFCSTGCRSKYTWARYRLRMEEYAKDNNITVSGKLELNPKGAVSQTNIRYYARKTYEKWVGPIVSCERCGYNRVPPDIAHVKSVCEFDDTTPVYEINDAGNLVALCKNCHTEFDRGLIPVPEIQKLVAARRVS